jgi:hypothetical protein
MEPTQETQQQPELHARPRIEILVNEHEVIVHDHRLTGLQIKEAAIAQHVPIQLDFVLSEDRPHQHPKIIGDDDAVTVNKHSKFHAVSPDDNS